MGTWIWNKSNKSQRYKPQRSPFGEYTIGDGEVTVTVAVRIGIAVMTLAIVLFLGIMSLAAREDETLTGEGKFVLKPSQNSLYCEKYDNVSSDTQGFFITSAVLSVINFFTPLIFLFMKIKI